MDSKELEPSGKIALHQILPAKLATDIGTSTISTVLLWDHELLPGLLVGIIPSIIASALIIRFLDLESYRRSRLGEYAGKYMTSGMQGLRLVGQVIAWLGAWYQSLSVIGAGFLLILVAWARGKILPTV